MKFTYALIFYFFAFVPVFSFSQTTKIDSLRIELTSVKEDTNKINTINALAWELKYNNPDTAIILGNQALDLCDRLSSISNLTSRLSYLKSNSLGNLGVYYYLKSDYHKALDYYHKALKIDEELNNKKGIAANNIRIGIVYMTQADSPKALSYYLNGLKIYEELKDNDGIALAINYVGHVYSDQADYTKALDYYSKALKMAEGLEKKDYIVSCLVNIGNAYVDQSEVNPAGRDSLLKRALDCHLKALKIAEELGNKNHIAGCLGNIGNVYSEQADYYQALDYYFRALKMAENLGDKNGIATHGGSIGRLYIKTGKFKEAEVYLKNSLAIHDDIGALDKLMLHEKFLSQLYDTTGRYQLALIHYKKAVALKDSLFNMDKENQITRKELNYEFEKKQAAAKAEQDKKNILVAEEKRKEKIIRNSIIIMLALMLVTAMIIFRSLRITRQQKTMIESQKYIVEEKQKEITDSITYAKRLQTAILPPVNFWKKYLPESFVLYQPKDIVSGDFYWLENVNDLVLFAAADCTGHGVSGAMVSVVCSNALNRTVKEFGITEPAKILDKTRELVLETFEKSNEEVKDGMDISLCCLNTKTNKLLWSGANNPLWYIREHNLFEIKGDKQPIGQNDNPTPFTTHSINLQQGDTVYIFTDGYADQFGGEKGKKFKYRPLKELLLSLQNKPIAVQQEELYQKFTNWKKNTEQTDDVLVIGFKI